VRAVMLSDSEMDERKLPAEVPADKLFEMLDNDIRRIHQVAVTIDSIPDEKLSALIEMVKKFERLTVIRRIKPVHPGQILINAEIYTFKEVAWPKMVVPRHTLEQEMLTAGIKVPIKEAVQNDPIGYLQAASMAYKEYASAVTKLEEAMLVIEKLNMLKARMAFYTSKRALVDVISLRMLREQ